MIVNVMYRRGFTLVELLVVSTVIVILAGIVVISFTSWQERMADKEVRTELNTVQSSLHSYHNFNNSYPDAGADNSLPSNVMTRRSPNVKIEYYPYGDSFCIQGQSIKFPSIIYIAKNYHQGSVEKSLCLL